MAAQRWLAGWRLHLALLVELIMLLLVLGLCSPARDAACVGPGCPENPSPPVGGDVAAALPVRVSVPAVPKLWPGVAVPVDVVIENPHPRPARIATVGLTVTAVQPSAAREAAGARCPISDFRTAAGTLDTTIDPGGTLSLTASTIPRRRWPRLELRNTAVNQDSCQGATLRLVATVRGVLQ